MSAKRRGGQGLNPEELVPDDKRDELRLFYYGTQDWMPEGPEDDEAYPEDVRRAFEAGFHLALEELGIERIIEIPSSERCPSGNCALFNATCGVFCPDTGAVLVRWVELAEAPK